MTAIALIVQPGSTPSSVATSLDMVSIAARYPEAAACRIDLLSLDGGRVNLSSSLGVETAPLPDSLAAYAALILPGFFADGVESLIAQIESIWQPVVERLPTLPSEAPLAASCYGTFVLAASGLLDGRQATTTWWLRDVFRQRYPRVELDADRAMVDDGRYITGGAMTAHTDLSLHVLRRLFGARLAREVAGIMLVDGARVSQRPFMTLERRFADPLAQAAADWMAARIAQPAASEALASALGVSYRTLHRRFSVAAGMAPLAYLQALRVERAKELLEESRLGIEGIVEQVGYSDVPAFRRLFVREVGVSPAQYRQRFRCPGA